MRSKKPKWARKLNKKDLKHIADVSASGRASLRALKLNANNQMCIECRMIASKAGVK